MKKQLIIKIPNDMPFKDITEFIHQQYVYGYPIVLFDDWKYEVVECSDPILITSNNNSKTDLIRNKLYESKNKDLSKVILDCLDYCENNGFGKDKTIDRIRKTVNGEISKLTN